MISGDDIKRIKLQLASPEDMLRWSHGEVTESETINYRTHRPERGGLYAEEIFGPENSYECACGKYKGKKYEGITCEKCHVLVTDSSVRRVNMGHISLASPVVHFWFLKGVSSLLARLLGMKKKELQRIAYYETEPIEQALYLVTASESREVRPGETLYSTEVDILNSAYDFSVEQAFFVDDAPAIVASEAGRVTVEERTLTNGERSQSVVIGSQEYPIVGEVRLLVEDGDEVEAGTKIAERPVGELCSQTAFDMLVDRYGQEVVGEPIDREVLDSLVFLITKVRNPAFPRQMGERITFLEKRAYERVYPDGFVAATGASGIKGLLEEIDFNELHEQLSTELEHERAMGNKRRLVKRLEVVDQIRDSENNPQDMILDVIPVLPPDLRPMIQLEGGKFATTDLNDLYRRIINRNNRLKKLIDMGAPEVILRNERRMLQEAVDALIHNEKKESPIRGRDNRPLKSLSERIHGKHGRLRRNLLGRRVDYSGRAVIVVDPKLKMSQCGLPKKIALELFKPFILHYLESTTFSDFDEIKNKALLGGMPQVWDILEKLIVDHPVLLNRAPTLHRLSMQSFEPVLVDGDAIHLHPLMCTPYNADFDGDQMAIHLPLSPEAIAEARELMAAPRNILSPAHGEPLSLPTQDPIYAYYYLTLLDEDALGAGKYFRDLDEAWRAQEEGVIDLHAPIKVRINGKVLDTTLGRAQMNEIFPEEIRDYQRVMDRRAIKEIIKECHHRFGWKRTSEVLDDLKDLGFKYAMLSGLTISIKDCLIPAEKEAIVKESYAVVKRIQKMYQVGLATEQERKRAVIRVWRRTVDAVEHATMENLRKHKYNAVYGIVNSGARGGPDQVKQLCGMRGPMAGPSGEIIERPVVSNFREGLDMMEYFISTHGGRKGAADTALKTADSGYLTRRLVDATSDMIVREVDCGTSQGVDIDPLRFSKHDIMEPIEMRIYGRVTSEAVIDPRNGEVIVEAEQWIDRDLAHLIGRLEAMIPVSGKGSEHLVGAKSVDDVHDAKTGRVIVQADELITPRLVQALKKAKIKEINVRPRVVIRSPMVCESINGVCQKCYGYDMSTHRPVELGTAIGVIAAQSVGEPGTQLTMRTFHTGGVAGEDITQGLPRAEELFEARNTMKSAIAGISPLDGYIESITPLETGKDRVEVIGDQRIIQVPSVLEPASEGEEVSAAQLIKGGSPCPGEVFIIESEGRKEMLVIDADAGDRSYILPRGARPCVNDGDVVSEGDPLTERFNIEPVFAEVTGTVEVSEEDDRVFSVIDEEGEKVDHKIAYGARLMVEPGSTVKAGDQLTSRSKPIFIASESAGTVLLLEDRVVVYNPEGRSIRFPLTANVSPAVGHGEKVRARDKLVEVEVSGVDVVEVEKAEVDGEITRLTVRAKSEVEIDQMATVRAGDKVKKGDLLTKGVVAPHVLLDLAGVNRAREYFLTEIHKVYKVQGVDINDKHLEVIIRQILNNVRVTETGDSRFHINDLVLLEEFQKELRDLVEWNQNAERIRSSVIGEKVAQDAIHDGKLIASSGEVITPDLLRAARNSGIESLTVMRGGEPFEVPLSEKRLPRGERELLRISKAALQTKGWLSAASFQRTTKVLSEAALRGEVDNLDGLKPSVIVGKKIPSGTGFKYTKSAAEVASEEGQVEGTA
ncbi:DNA-directed RNA polymerase subunit beta' [Candidatus Bipolaricaulota bacterium]|nr:DNA-directed RNA polymerase subunit beta' [Candidatus Bipolaricaulota bacterium]